VKSLPLLLQAETCNIFVYDPDNGRAWVEVGTGVGERDFDVPTKSTLVGKVIASGEPLIAHDFRFHDEGFEGERARGPMSRNAAYAPIRSGYRNEVIGALEVLNKRGGQDFTDADVEILEQAAESIRDLVDSAFLAQKDSSGIEELLYTEAPAILAMIGLALVASLITTLMSAARCTAAETDEAISQALALF
jgi:GAF domain-containing protein